MPEREHLVLQTVRFVTSKERDALMQSLETVNQILPCVGCGLRRKSSTTTFLFLYPGTPEYEHYSKCGVALPRPAFRLIVGIRTKARSQRRARPARNQWRAVRAGRAVGTARAGRGESFWPAAAGGGVLRVRRLRRLPGGLRGHVHVVAPLALQHRRRHACTILARARRLPIRRVPGPPAAFPFPAVPRPASPQPLAKQRFGADRLWGCRRRRAGGPDDQRLPPVSGLAGGVSCQYISTNLRQLPAML